MCIFDQHIFLLSFALLVVAVSAEGPEGCAECSSPDICPKTDCPYGFVEDVCGCCPEGVCAKAIGHRCYNASIEPSLPIADKQYGFCGGNLVCALRMDLNEMDHPEASCACEDKRTVCGSDNSTYENICLLKQETNSTEHLLYYGPCKSAPEILTGLQDSLEQLNSPFVLSCEAQGNPIPLITWIHNPTEGNPRLLPADDPSVTVTHRGGPDRYMQTSWMRIVALRAADAGIYVCRAANEEGTRESSSNLRIY